MKNEAYKLPEQNKTKLHREQQRRPITMTASAGLASSLTQEKRPSRISRIVCAIKRMLKRPDLTLEQWERLERKHSPHSSHHAQIYYRERR
jgi:uncharacterized protein YjhX (UPF0386 family)